MEGSFLSGFSFSVTLFALGSRLFLIHLEINTHIYRLPVLNSRSVSIIVVAWHDTSYSSVAAKSICVTRIVHPAYEPANTRKRCDICESVTRTHKSVMTVTLYTFQKHHFSDTCGVRSRLSGIRHSSTTLRILSQRVFTKKKDNTNCNSETSPFSKKNVFVRLSFFQHLVLKVIVITYVSIGKVKNTACDPAKPACIIRHGP